MSGAFDKAVEQRYLYEAAERYALRRAKPERPHI